jgi:DNA polymerase-3 subunit beta
MKLTLPREALLRPLKSTVPVANGKATLPILNHVMIAAEAGALTVTSTDTEAQVIARADVAMDHEATGAVCAPARKLLDIVRLLPDGADLKIDLDGQKLRIVSGRSRFHIGTLPADSFPLFDAGDVLCTVNIESGRIGRALDVVAPAMGISDVRYYLNGTLLRISDGDMQIVGSDGHRISRYRLHDANIDGEDCDAIIPRAAALEMSKALRDADGHVTIGIGARSVTLNIGRGQFATRTIEARYPNFERLIPTDFSAHVECARSDLVTALQRIATLCADSRGGRLVIDDHGIALNAANSENESAVDEISAAKTGDNANVGYNIDYLLNALAQVTSDRVCMDIAAAGYCMISDPADDAMLALIAPTRL